MIPIPFIILGVMVLAVVAMAFNDRIDEFTKCLFSKHKEDDHEKD